MDPMSMGATGQGLLAAVTGGLAMAAPVYQSASQAEAMRAQADADQARAVQQSAIAAEKSLEERAGAQRAAGEEIRTAKLAQSRLGAVAGASGSGASDPTVMQTWGSIESEGQKNAAAITAAGEQRARGMTYQDALDRWSTDVNAGLKRKGATATAIGGWLTGAGNAASSMTTAMGYKYGAGRTQAAGGLTGYGG